MSGTLFFSSLMAETSSFTNLPTTFADYAPGLLRGVDCLVDEAGRLRPGLAPLDAFARQRGWKLSGGLSASASVGAPTLHRDYLLLRDALLDGVRAARPQLVVLMLHGAMMSTECEDCEGDILREVRSLVGPDVPVVAVLDPHAHLTDMMVEQADLLVFLREYPHVDWSDRMEEALAVAARLLDEGLRPLARTVDCRLLGFFPTDIEPMRGLVDWLEDVSRRPVVVSVSFVHGFPWGDMPDTGARVLVYTDPAADPDGRLADAVGHEIHEAVWAIRDRTMPPMIGLEPAIEAARRPHTRPLVLADIADNPGGGAPSDSSFLLRALLEGGIDNAAVGLLYDPQAVRMCHQVGEGGRLLVRVGGKTGPASGDPLDLDAEVMGLRTAAEMAIGDAARFPMGDTAWIRSRGIDIVLCSIRVQLYHPDGFAHIGLDPVTRRVLVVKSSTHFRAFFGDLASEILAVSTPGAIDFDFCRLPYRRLRRPVYPLVEDPFGGREDG